MTEKRRIAVLEILALPGKNLLGALVARQYAAVFPQAIAVWCAQAGHEVTYRTYCGRGDLPDLGKPDVLFVSCTSECSALAYLAAKGMSGRRPRATRTVIGGPHARCYPEDCAVLRRGGGRAVRPRRGLAASQETWATAVKRRRPPRTADRPGTLALPPPGLADRRPVAGLPCGRNAVVVGLWGRMHVLH